MNNNHKAAVLGIVLVGGLAILSGQGCGSSPSSPSNPTATPAASSTPTSSPTITQTPTSTATATITSTPTATPTATVAIEWGYVAVDSYLGNPGGSVQLRVNGSPVTDAAVTMAGTFPGAPVTAAYQFPVTLSGQVLANYQFQPFTYSPGQTYILSTTALGKTAAVTATAPGNISMSLDSNGAVTLANAALPGSDNLVLVNGNGGTTTTLYLSNPAFPVTIAPPPSGAYPGGSGSVYTVSVVARYITTTISNATDTLGDVELWEQKNQPVTIP